MMTILRIPHSHAHSSIQIVFFLYVLYYRFYILRSSIADMSFPHPFHTRPFIFILLSYGPR